MSEKYANTNLESMVPKISSKDDVVKAINDTISGLKSGKYTVAGAHAHLMSTFTPSQHVNTLTPSWILANHVLTYVDRVVRGGYEWIKNLTYQVQNDHRLIQSVDKGDTDCAREYREIAVKAQQISEIASVCAKHPSASNDFIMSPKTSKITPLSKDSFVQFLTQIRDVVVHNIRISKQIHKLSKSMKSLD